MNKYSKIYIAGHRGMVGSAIVRDLNDKKYVNLLTRTHKQLDLTNQVAVYDFFQREQPEFVFLAAAKVGGIYANSTYPADFIRENIQIQTNIIDAAYKFGVKKLLFLGSSCIYPKFAPQPISEQSLLTGELEATNQWYAIAKIAGIKMCQAYRQQYGFDAIAVMPTNLYGSYDNFSLENAHVLPALIRKFHNAKQQQNDKVEIWGTGKPRREFLYVDDLADACIYLMECYSNEEIVNIGVGKDISIKELAELIQDIIGFKGELIFNSDKPDGTPRKLLDVSYLHSQGWQAKIELEEGIRQTYQWFLENSNNIRL
ncbi:GDP-L-fucose synthase [Lutibacter sp.]